MIRPMPPWLTRRASGPTDPAFLTCLCPTPWSAPLRSGAQPGGAGQTGDLPICDPMIA